MTRRIRLSDRSVSRLRAAKREYTVWDVRVADFGVRVRPSGYRTFVCLEQRDGTSRRHTLGPVNLMSVEQVRARCRDKQIDKDTGMEQTDRTNPVSLFRHFVANAWKVECHVRYKPSFRRSVYYMLTRQLLPVFGNQPIDSIERTAVNRWFDGYSMTAPGGANMALDLLRQIMNRAMVHGHVQTNPASAIRRNPGRRMTRFLSRDETVRLHTELARCISERPSRQAQADIIRLLLFTGCRCGEIRHLKWKEVGDDVLDLCDSKTGPRRVYLNSAARDIIERQPRTCSPFVFPFAGDPSRSVSRAMSLWRLVREHAGIKDVRLHDLRHNLASHAVMQGVPLPTVAKLLGHRRISMTLRYAHVHDKEVEAAAERVGRIITNIWNPSGSYKGRMSNSRIETVIT